MADYETRPRQINPPPWRSIFRFDILLPIFLLVGWSLIFTTATLALQIQREPWLEIGLVSQVSADYSVVKAPDVVAPVKPEVVEVVQREDKIYLATPTPLALATPTLLPEPTELVLGDLEVSLGGPYTGEEGSEIPLEAELVGFDLNSVPGVVSYVWDTDNDGDYDDVTDSSSAVVLFYDEGEYLVKVRATNLLGQEGSAETVVSVSNAPPLVTLAQNIRAEEGQEVVLTATAEDPGQDVLLYEWDFGDDSPRVGDTLTPRHVYRDNGNYTVNLTVSDTDGGVTAKSLVVAVANLPPQVNAGANQRVDEGGTVAFSGTATDPGAEDNLSFSWDFNYDGKNFTPEANGRNASKVYPDGPLNAVAALRVRDKDGDETIDTVKVTVNNVPPEITDLSQPGQVGEGSLLTLNVNARDVGKDTLTYFFDWGDGNDESGNSGSASHTWADNNNYTVRVRVEDGDGGRAEKTTTVSVLNRPPVAVASATSGVLEGSPILFDASDSSDPGLEDTLTYEWDFGDGQSSGPIAEQTANHTYGDNGLYSAGLVVTDDDGAASDPFPVGITIYNANPTANAGSDRTIDECHRLGDNNYDCSNVPINYQGAASDPGSADIPTLAYAWDFNYKDNVFDEQRTVLSGTHSYSNLDGPGSYVVALRVRDKDYTLSPAPGNAVGEAFDTFSLTVNNIAPFKVSAGGPYNCFEMEKIQLTATAEDAPADKATLKFDWDLNNNPDYEVDNNSTPQYECKSSSTNGSSTVRLRVTDKDGGIGFASTQINVSNAPPKARANGPYTATVETMPLTLSAAGSDDPTDDFLTYRWNFGDGTPPVVVTTTTVTHTYADDGVYTATLRVDDGRGGTDTDTAQVRVLNLPPNPKIDDVSPPAADENEPVTFSGSARDPDDASGLTFIWDFGDNSPPQSGLDLTEVEHTYTQPGDYEVKLTVVDDNNASGDSELVGVTIGNVKPTAVIADPGPVNEGDSVTLDGRGSTDAGGGQLSYTWDLNDDGQFGDATTDVVNFSWSEPGDYIVTLRVTDGQDSDNASITVSVGNLAPKAVINGPSEVDEGDTVTFDGSNSEDPGAGDSLKRYEWDFDYDGANFTVDASGPDPTAQTQYPDGPASFTVALRVVDNNDEVSPVKTLDITVKNKKPQNLSISGPSSTTVDTPTDFAGSADDVPADQPLTYSWQVEKEDGSFENIDGQNIQVTWTISGTYTIILEVGDGNESNDTTVDVDVQ